MNFKKKRGGVKQTLKHSCNFNNSINIIIYALTYHYDFQTTK